MNILIVSNIELDEANAAGNTFANWLSGWPNTTVSSLYSRERFVKNSFCDMYLSISPINVLKNLFTFWRIGKFYDRKTSIDSHEVGIEGSLIKKTKVGKGSYLYLLNDLIIKTKLWQNRNYVNFIHTVDPDIVFYFAKSESFIYQNIKYIKKHTNAKLVSYFADDMYTIYKRKGLMNWIYRRRFLKLLKMADKNYGASLLMCDNYSKKFGIDITPLYKGCEISTTKNKLHDIIKIVYAGNLYYGRDETLVKIVSHLKEINKYSKRFFLEIYTNTEISDSNKLALEVEGTSKLMGGRPYSEIKKIMRDSDIVLHVESFNPMNMDIVRLSYSTKISDCLQSGSMMLVVGPRGIASVEEAINIDGVKVISNESNIFNDLMDLMKNKENILSMAKKTNEYAKEKFPINVVRDRLCHDFSTLIKGI